MVGSQHSPNGKLLPGSPTEISPHGDCWGHLWCWTLGITQTWRRWVGLTATSAQILEDSQTRLCSTLKSHPIRDHSDSAHFLSWDGPTWSRRFVTSYARVGSLPIDWTRAWRPFYGSVWAVMQAGSHFPLLTITPTSAIPGSLNKDPRQPQSLSHRPMGRETSQQHCPSVEHNLSLHEQGAWMVNWGSLRA